MVRVKSNFDGDIRRFGLGDSPALDALRQQVRKVYDIKDFTIKYKDEDGDLVTISSDAELSEAVADMDKKAILRVDIFKTTSSTQPVEASPPSESSEAVTKQPAVVERSDTVTEAGTPSEAVQADAVEQPAATEQKDENTAGDSTTGPGASASPNPSASAEAEAEPTLEELLNNMVRIAAQVMGGAAAAAANCSTACMNAQVTGNREAEEARNSPVPRPALGFGSTGSEVRQLQKVLTDLGYMTPADYRFRSGLYGPRTASGVVRFRMECGLGYGMYDDDAAAALRSLVESGVPATMASGGGSDNSENNETNTNTQTDEKTEA